ncbi:class I SAM-dependent methyltransferase [Halobacteriovorax sp. GB3]|uniref:class I SAM-dependent rRNA methyltransferase n=1 Tax=Halobacteriovorax sp. GB3 TaxID=2719615 RepID=UPI002361793D|nr:class I SAM-dependent methyltransferase [Halobacteriovorax sp. GB3]MDD0854619.1 class I SAM-dependent methyltransferase [Halobacteriovorax sp. GB3]
MLKEVELSKSGYNKLISGEKGLYLKDFNEIGRSFIPGQWIKLKTKEGFFGFINVNIDKGPVFRCVGRSESLQQNEDEFAKFIITRNILSALDYRSKFKRFSEGARLIFGDEDSLPGLIVDSYKNIVIVQINTAGIDRYRDLVKEVLEENLDREVYFLDNDEYRANELLPRFNETQIDKDILIEESGIKYSIPASHMQKIGYYYDHRDNRDKMKLRLLDYKGQLKKGVDLFSYVGSWGLHALKGNVEYVDFVDQANMKDVTEHHLKLNGFEGQGQFHRSDVFKFLLDAKSRNEKYDLVICDPPAFAKNENAKKSAIRGYDKLYQNIFDITENEGLLVAASCTHYISLDELDKIVLKAAQKKNYKVFVQDIGIQGSDHNLETLNSKSNYIKYILYYVRYGEV